MRMCPYCQTAPDWSFAMMTTYKKKDGSNYFMMAPTCTHVQEFSKHIGPVADSLRSLYEARWDAQAEELFKRYTTTWTPESRERYRAQIWPARQAVSDESYQKNVPWHQK